MILIIKATGKAHGIQSLKSVEKYGFCLFCLGANVPQPGGHVKGKWCCGSWVDEILPPFKICENFRLDKDVLKRFVDGIQSDDN